MKTSTMLILGTWIILLINFLASDPSLVQRLIPFILFCVALIIQAIENIGNK